MSCCSTIPSINAFVAGGQAIYIHTGLIDAADTANEVQGVLAHELGHITGGHVVSYRRDRRRRQPASRSCLGACRPAAAAAGAGEAAMGG